MPTVHGTFHSEDAAHQAAKALRERFSADAIAMQFVRSRRRRADDRSGYDPTAAARLAGTAINTMAATGANLVGNSTTVDVSLGEVGELLRLSAEDEAQNGKRASTRRIEATVTCDDPGDVAFAKDVLAANGAREIRVEPD